VINKMATQKTTSEIRALLTNADKDFEEVENKALNDYLPRIFQSCPLTEDVCTTKQCVECEVFKRSAKTPQKNRNPKRKPPC
jgi:hypothetical protein